MRALGACTAATLLSLLALLWFLDVRYTSFTSPVAHVRYMVGYANHLRPHGRHGSNVATAARGPGIAPRSSPWQWLADQRPIVYYQRTTRAAPDRPFRTVLLFQGRIHPAVVFLALPALAVAFAVGRRGDDLGALAVAWFTATFGAFVVLDVRHHPSYLHYMLVVLPAVYLAVARMLSSRAVPRPLIALYGAVLLYGLGALYPIRFWAGP